MIAPLPIPRDRFDAVLLDLDGTLLDGESRLTPRTTRAVRALVEAGFAVLLCTGRSLAGAVGIHEELGLSTPIVAYNGCYIGPRAGRAWRRLVLSDAALPVIERLEREALFAVRHVCSVSPGEGDAETSSPDADRKVSVESLHGDYERVAAWYPRFERVAHPGALPRTSLMRATCFFDSWAALEGAWGGVREVARPHVMPQAWPLALFPEFEGSPLLLLELQAQGQGKAAAFEFLGREWGIAPERVIAVGDQDNDLSMLRGAGLAVGMGNASPRVREVAHLVIGRHDEEGLAAWIEAGLPCEPRGT